MIKWFNKQPIGTKLMILIGLCFVTSALICCSNLLYDDGKSSTVEVVKITDTPEPTVDKEIEKIVEETLKATQTPKKDMNIDEYLESIVNKKLGKSKLISIKDGDTGTKDITLKGSENITTNMTLDGMLIDAYDYLKAISKNEKVLKLKSITLIFQMNLIDKYGNEEPGNVVLITISIETLKKINWDNFIFDDIQNVSDTYYVHPAFKK